MAQRVYHRQTQRYSGTAWAFPSATATFQARTVGGAVVQSGAASYDATYRRFYFDTGAGYTAATLYLAYFTVTIGATAYSPNPDPFVYAGAAADVTGPGPATIGVPTVTQDTAVFPHTPPSDADYASTTIYSISHPGGTLFTASGSGSTITVTGLAAGLRYIAVAVAYDATGNPSTIGAGSVVEFETLTVAVPDYPLWLKWYVNDEETIHEFGPHPMDQDAASYERGSRSHRVQHMGRGRTLRLRLETHCPRPGLAVHGIGLVALTADAEPRGFRGPYGSR